MSPPLSIVVNETGAASFQCEVRGNPEPEVTWLKQNSSIFADKRIVMSGEALKIQEVTSQDGGMYTCKAMNLIGVVTSSATLTVQGEGTCCCIVPLRLFFLGGGGEKFIFGDNSRGLVFRGFPSTHAYYTACF